MKHSYWVTLQVTRREFVTKQIEAADMLEAADMAIEIVERETEDNIVRIEADDIEQIIKSEVCHA